jgi:hypothetical protein
MSSIPSFIRRTISLRFALLLIPALAVVAGCGSSGTVTAPTVGLPTILTETFSGSINRNSAYTHPFSVMDSGNVTVFLITSTDNTNPDNNAIPLGVSLGTWNGASCAIVVANDNVSPGTSITGQATAAGNLCVRVYDVGFIPSSASYELLVDHN